MSDSKLSVGVKYDQDKYCSDLLSTLSLIELSKVATMGAKKYEKHNWRKGMDWSRILNAVYRHLDAFKLGENLDPESKLPHLAHAFWGLMVLTEFQLTGNGKNDVQQKFELVKL